MAKKNEDFVTHIASRNEDFPQWYTDVVVKTDMVDYSEVKGCMVIKPYGYAVWELIQSELDAFPAVHTRKSVKEGSRARRRLCSRSSMGYPRRKRGACRAPVRTAHQRNHNLLHVQQMDTIV